MARAEVFFSDHPEPLKEATRRLKAFAAAGADCLYAPGVKTREDIRALVEAIAPKPLNVLVGGPSELSVADLAALGVPPHQHGRGAGADGLGGLPGGRRAEIAGKGTFAGLGNAASGSALNALFAADAGRRSK